MSCHHHGARMGQDGVTRCHHCGQEQRWWDQRGWRTPEPPPPTCPLHSDCLRRASEAEVILVHLERRAEELGDTAAGREVSRLVRVFRAGQHRVGSVT